MEKTFLKAQIGDTEYTLEYTRDSVCKAEEAFGVSMLIREEPKSYGETMKFLKALLYGALIKNHKDIKVEDMGALSMTSSWVRTAMRKTHWLKDWSICSVPH